MKILNALFVVAITCAAAAAAASPAEGGKEATFLENTRQLTYEGRRSGEGYFSPDGNYFVFQSEREPKNPFYQIYILSFLDGEIHRVSPGTGKTTCAFFRPGTDELLFASTHLDPDAVKKQQEEIDFRASGKERRYSWDYDEYFDIFASSRAGNDLVQLTDAYGYDAEGAYSPDGKRIVFCSMRDAYPPEKLSEKDRKKLEYDTSYFGEIYVMNADGSKQKRLTDWPGYDGGPFFTPDGGRIIWRHFSEDGMIANVYTMRTDGSERRQLTDFGSMCWAPYMHPSGKYAIFTTNKQGFSNFELYIVDTAGEKEPVRVTFTDGFDGLPVFSPDGTRLAWTSNRTTDNRSQLFIADWNHEAAMEMLKVSPPRSPGATEEALGGNGGGHSQHAPWLHPDQSSHGGTGGEEAAALSAASLRSHVEYLASDELEGRLTGSKGARKAGKYIARQFETAGLQPLGDGGDYFQRFPFTSGVEVEKKKNELRVTSAEGRVIEFEVDKDFRPLAFTENAAVEGEVVFAGYGLRAPGDAETGYDSYADLDVKDKIVLALRYVPEDVDMERRQQLNVYAGLRYKALQARENGAKALLIVTGPNSPNAGELVDLKFDQSLASSGIPVASISGNVASALFAGTGKSLQEAQDGLDVENPHVETAFLLEGVKVELATAVKREKGEGRNVVGYIPAPENAGHKQYVLIGAHYDHIGHGEIGSLARKGEEGQIHNGADDNASGTSVLIDLGRAIAADVGANPGKYTCGFIFAAWSGEEMGIIGSNYFAQNPPIPLEETEAYFNFDMVGRLRDNKLILQGTGSSSEWIKLIEKKNVVAGFNLTIQEDPYLPTDVTAFYPNNVPVVSFFTGSHEEYNRPVDDAETLDYEGMSRIGNLAKMMILDIAKRTEPMDYVKVPRKKEKSGMRASLRAYLGTIPDYASSDDVEGVKLSGVRADGPADKAGLRGGDIIIQFAGQEIKNIYDYTYALGAVKIGEPVEMIVLRDGKEVTITVVPEARK
jgi:Tol biopolymer transport system component/Zn-dependent M28 family amino/carboxypeptidase